MSKVEDGVTIESLLTSFESWQTAKKELIACYKDCEYSAGYHCWRLAEAEKAQREKFGKDLEALIDSRIAKATGEQP